MIKGERLNSISHLIGAALALAGGAVLITFAAIDGDSLKIISYSIYGATLFLLYLISTIYHSLSGPAKRIFKVLDHQAIYLVDPEIPLFRHIDSDIDLDSLSRSISVWYF